MSWRGRPAWTGAPFLCGFRCEVLGGGDSGQYKSVKRESGLGRESEQFTDEVSLADRISFGQPSHSALPNHARCLDPYDFLSYVAGRAGRMERARAVDRIGRAWA